ncbi:hypothetical protein GCM10010347_42130 [Streptomyces cirratus]|uniref:Uncharacterized protein n=1 Tax=Streptomyces cirratus TaxID=68187 RepID=A0ABQ3F0T7_9ACTN|nr:hypothetical protein GCM10010347_42130 [Streptomyces cirratus]
MPPAHRAERPLPRPLAGSGSRKPVGRITGLNRPGAVSVTGLRRSGRSAGSRAPNVTGKPNLDPEAHTAPAALADSALFRTR